MRFLMLPTCLILPACPRSFRHRDPASIAPTVTMLTSAIMPMGILTSIRTHSAGPLPPVRIIMAMIMRTPATAANYSALHLR